MEELKKLRQQKVRQKLRYLQLELMETKIIYKSSLTKFHKDFSQDINEIPKDEKVDNKDPYEEIQTDIEEDTIKKVYRKVAAKTHPDKGGDEEKFKIAAKANKNNDFGTLLELADELEIDILLDDELINEMNKQCKAVIENITKMKTTTAWTWVHCHPNEKEGLRQYILTTINPPE
jgi:hypothetical protein|tara:strand:- start:11 stop:538 length:528 start_codon:yes stop_codon:yes gene_type:complete